MNIEEIEKDLKALVQQHAVLTNQLKNIEGVFKYLNQKKAVIIAEKEKITQEKINNSIKIANESIKKSDKIIKEVDKILEKPHAIQKKDHLK